MEIIKLIKVSPEILMESNLPVSSEQEYSKSTSYSLGNKVKVSFENNGSDKRIEEIYESLSNSNTGNYPPDSPTKWSSLGVGNRFKMFDQYINTLSCKTGKIEFELNADNTDSIGFFKLKAKELTLTQIIDKNLIDPLGLKGADWVLRNNKYENTKTSSLLSEKLSVKQLWYQIEFTVSDYAEGEICGYLGGKTAEKVRGNGKYSQLIKAPEIENNLVLGGLKPFGFSGKISNVSIKKIPKFEKIKLSRLSSASYWDYFFTDLEYREDFIFSYPRYALNSRLKIEILWLPDEETEIGMCCLGSKLDLGITAKSPSIGISDYSIKETDSMGRTYLKQGSFARENDMEFWLRSSQVDSIRRRLEAVRGTASIFNGNNQSSNEESLITYGYIKDFNIIIPGEHYSRCSLSIAGLI